MARLRGAQALVQALEAHGVEYVFGLPGHGNMNILDALYDSTQIQFKLVRHEQAAAHIEVICLALVGRLFETQMGRDHIMSTCILSTI